MDSFRTFCTNDLKTCNGDNIFECRCGHTKVYLYAINAKCDMFAVLIPFQVIILCAGMAFPKQSSISTKETVDVIFYDLLLFFCAQLYRTSRS